MKSADTDTPSRTSEDEMERQTVTIELTYGELSSLDIAAYSSIAEFRSNELDRDNYIENLEEAHEKLEQSYEEFGVPPQRVAGSHPNRTEGDR